MKSKTFRGSDENDIGINRFKIPVTGQRTQDELECVETQLRATGRQALRSLCQNDALRGRATGLEIFHRVAKLSAARGRADFREASRSGQPVQAYSPG
jgi:hypothetical protein